MEKTKPSHSTFRQFLRYNIVGILNTVVDYMVFTILTKIAGVVYLIANPLAYGCGLINSYILNSKWTFREQSRHSAKQTTAFVAINLLAMGISTAMMWVMQHSGVIHDELVCKLVTAPVTLAINFIGNKLLVFRQ